jgi:hypothetical protein
MSATLSEIHEAIQRTRGASGRVRAQRGIDAIIGTLAQAAQNWLAPASPWRLRALEHVPSVTGFSPAMVNQAIDLTFGSITLPALSELLDRELGDRLTLDKFCPRGNLQTRATGPDLITHILAGNVPVPGVVSICCGLLLKSANIVKLSSRDPILPRLFVESIREVDAELADCVATFEWPGAEVALTQHALSPATAVLAYGNDSTIAALRKLAPPAAIFIGYGHKISFGLVAREAMTEESLPALVEGAAFDVSVYDQQGCLSPHVFYVEEGGALGPRRFAGALADAMKAYQLRLPRGTRSVEEAAQLTRMRQSYLFRSASDRRVAVWASDNTTDWVVIYEDDPSFTPSCLNRVVFVKPTDGFPRVLKSIQRYLAEISTVGLSPLNERTTVYADEFAKAGIPRVCPIGQMQRPSLAWSHDGRPNLAGLVKWTDLEAA